MNNKILLFMISIITFVSGCQQVNTKSGITEFILKPGFYISYANKPDIVVINQYSFGYQNSLELINAVKNIFKTNYACNVKEEDEAKNSNYVISIDNYLSDKHGNMDSYKNNFELLVLVSIYRGDNLKVCANFNFTTKITNEEDTLDSINKIANEIALKIFEKGIFVNDKFEVKIPAKCNNDAKSLILSSKYELAKSKLKLVLPEIDIIKSGLNEIRSYFKHNSGRNIESDLANYYLYLLALETSFQISYENLHTGYIKIFMLSYEKDTIEACSHALGRLETNGRI